MANEAPAHPGMALREVDTPALIIDLDGFERTCGGCPMRLRRPASDCGRMPRPTRARSLRISRSRSEQSASAARKYPKPRSWCGTASATSWSRTRSRASQSSTGWPRSPATPASRCASTTSRMSQRSPTPRNVPTSGCRCWSRSTSAPSVAGSPRESRRCASPRRSRARTRFTLAACRPITAPRSTCARMESGATPSRAPPI